MLKSFIIGNSGQFLFWHSSISHVDINPLFLLLKQKSEAFLIVSIHELFHAVNNLWYRCNYFHSVVCLCLSTIVQREFSNVLFGLFERNK